MKFKDVDAVDGKVVIALEDDKGKRHEIPLNSIDTASFISILRTKLEEAIGQPAAEGWHLPGMVRVQMAVSEEEIIFRIYMNDHIYHGYPVPKGTNLHGELKLLADRLEARNLAKATHPQSDKRN
jgi:hypothetical protein